MRPLVFKHLLNLYPPYWATGIRVTDVSADYRKLRVEMKLRWYNRNYVGTHFGGSLYAMTDPFFMLMLIQVLGRKFIVWDRAAHIDFIRPGRGRLQAEFRISDEDLAAIAAHTARGEKYMPEFTVDVRDPDGETVCRVVKTLYIRRKSAAAA